MHRSFAVMLNACLTRDLKFGISVYMSRSGHDFISFCASVPLTAALILNAHDDNKTSQTQFS